MYFFPPLSPPKFGYFPISLTDGAVQQQCMLEGFMNNRLLTMIYFYGLYGKKIKKQKSVAAHFKTFFTSVPLHFSWRAGVFCYAFWWS